MGKLSIIGMLGLLAVSDFAYAADCFLDGAMVPHQTSRVFFRKTYVSMSWGGECQPYSRLRTCNNGVLSGAEPYVVTGETFSHATCSSAVSLVQPVANVMSTWSLVYHDEFLQRSDDWQFENGPMWLGGYRVPERAVVADGYLAIQNRSGTRAPNPAQPTFAPTMQTTVYPSQNESAQLVSRREFRHGLFEARIKFAEGPSIDNAFWLMNNRGSEIDVAETLYINSTTYKSLSNLHPRRAGTNEPYGGGLPSSSSMERLIVGNNDFHVYSLLWESDKIVWYVDGQEVRRETSPQMLAVFNSTSLKIRLSTAMSNVFRWMGGGPLNDLSSSGQMVVDYVRVFERNGGARL